MRFKVDAPEAGAYGGQGGALLPRERDAGELRLHPRRRAVVARARWLTEGGPSGLVEVKLTTPLTLRPGIEYTASYLAPGGRYADQQAAFTSPRSVGSVHFPPTRAPVRRRLPYGGGFPTATWGSSSYYVSPLVGLDT